MGIMIRSERISDYSNIANINYEAFLGWHPDNQYVSEPILVDLLRHNSLFDPELSLVAEVDGEIAGHVLFSPYKFIACGEEQKGVVLAPIAVKPEFQKTGIGGKLIEEGHRRAKEKGFSFSLLCGHTGYYPRFGYKQEMFSVSGTKVNINIDDFSGENFSERPVKEQDLPWILKEWEAMHFDDTLACFPGHSISEWSNHGPWCRCSIVMKNDSILGFVRYARSTPLNIKELLVCRDAAQDTLAYIAWKNYGRAQGEISIAFPIDKLQDMIGSSDFFKLSDEQTPHKAFMLKVLDENSSAEKYCEQVEKGLLKPGIMVFPPIFDVDDGRTE